MLLKQLLLVLFFLAPVSAFACDTDPPPVALEFLKSKYVFLGQVTSKEYAKDSLTYTVTFTIDKHFKKGASQPKTLSFTLPAEGEITGSFSSCDFSVKKLQKWLVYTDEHDEILKFGFFGSNSKPLESFSAIPKQELEILESGNQIDISKINFERHAIGGSIYISKDYKRPTLTVSLDSLLSQLPKNNYKGISQSYFEHFIVHIDSLGNTTDLFIPDRQSKREQRDVYDLTYIKLQPLRNLDHLQKDLLHVFQAIKRWEPARFMDNRVNSQITFQVYLDKNGNLKVFDMY